MSQFVTQAIGATPVATTPANPGENPLKANSGVGGMEHSFSQVGHLAWQISAGFPGGHLGAGAGLVGAAAIYYAKIRMDTGVGPVRGQRREGFATKGEIKESLSAQAMIKEAPYIRPALYRLAARDIAALDVAASVGKDTLTKQQIYISIEDMLLMFGPPRVGKTAYLAGRVIDAPGACVTTSTRADVHKHSAHLRAKKGPVLVMNTDPSGPANTVKWSMVKGCREPHVAMRRAGYLLSAQSVGKVEDASFWNEQSYRIVRTLLMAADYGDKTLQDVRRWITNPADTEPAEILERVRAQLHPGWLEDMKLITNAPERTRHGVVMTAVSALECLALPGAANVVDVRPGEADFDAEAFLRQQGTLYLIGRHRQHGSVASLFAAMVGEIHDVAQELAAKSPDGRLDPPLAEVLDEAALIAPLPIQVWGADAGGSGITMTVSVQSPSQLYDRWGQNGGDTIWQLSNLMIFGGLKVHRDLENISLLCDEYEQEVVSHSTNSKGERTTNHSTQTRRVMKPAQIRKIKKWNTLYLSRNTSPLVVRYTPVWDRKDIKALAVAVRKEQKIQAKMEKSGVVFDKAPAPMAPPMPSYKPFIPPQTAPQQQPGQNPWITPVAPEDNPYRKAQ